jgi:hypothetical protein
MEEDGTTDINSDYVIAELTSEEEAELVFDSQEHRSQPSCQSDDEAKGESDLSLEVGE